MSINRNARFLVLGLIAVATAGCTTSDDPHSGGLINGIAGMTSGSYQQRLDDRQRQVDDLAQARLDMERQLSDVGRQRAGVQAEAAQLKERLALMERQNQEAHAQLMAAQQRELLGRAKLAELLAEQQAIESSIIGLIEHAQASPLMQASDSGAPRETDAERRLAMQQQKQKAEEVADRQRKLDSALSEVFGPAGKPK